MREVEGLWLETNAYFYTNSRDKTCLAVMALRHAPVSSQLLIRNLAACRAK